MSAQVTRRDFLKTAAVGSAALLGLPGGLSAASGWRRPPNFVVIFIDDMGYQDVGCFGSPLIKTPRIDGMAREGVRFTSFYAHPVCTPSRAALMTGCYPMRVSLPAVINQRSAIGISDYEITMAQMLKTRGYATGCIGKWHLGWQTPFLPTRHGFDYYYGIPYSNDMNGSDREPPGPPLMRNEKIIEQPAVQDTLTQRYTLEAVSFITRNRNRPFLLYLPHTMVHVPLHVSDAFRGKSARGLYGDVVEEIDWSTGEILDTLKKLGLDDNTMVVFTSDNGPWLIKKDDGGCALPLREGKGSTYEGGMRVPCVMRWPGQIPAGTACSEAAMTMDLFPTFARLAGAQVPRDRIIDGKDIWPLISGKPGAVCPHEAIFYYRADRLQAVRSGKWKLILERTADNVKQALYNLEADIGEKTDLAAAYPSVVNRLVGLAEQCRDDLGDSITGRKGRNCREPGRV